LDNALQIIEVISLRSPEQLIEVMKTLEQVDCPVFHHFSPGLYVRELNAPAGTVLIGYKQTTEHLNIFLKGKVAIVTNGEVETITAPMIFTGQPGRKVGYIYEDMVWLNVYPTTETDVATLEETYLDKSESWTDEELEAINKLQDKSADREDYYRMLEEGGFSAEQVRRESEFEGDQIPFPSGSYGVAVFPSPIEGDGLFATANFKPGDIIAPARIDIFRTPAGRYTNHSPNPNAVMVLNQAGIDLMAIKPIKGYQGGVIGDEITVDYRESIKIRRNEV
jgi:hypothetical protein